MRRYHLRCAVFLILTKIEKGKQYVLLQKRDNTGLLDGLWDVSVSGHLEKDETLKEAMIRETKEEIGVDLQKENLSLVGINHAKFKNKTEYIMVVFQTMKWQGQIQIMEPHKCSMLKWFAIDSLPNDIIDNRKDMISDYLTNNNYRETGFSEVKK